MNPEPIENFLIPPHPALSSKLGEKGRGWRQNQKAEEKEWKGKTLFWKRMGILPS